ncbi:restriction endonuclease subunit S [Vibrio breoganii]
MSCNWPLKRISEVANFENNKRVPLKSLDREKRQGDYPYYGASGIVDYIDDFIFDGNYLLISEDGENLRTRNTPIAFQAKGKFWVNNHAHIFSEKEDGILDYLEYYFSVLNIGAYITGAVQPKLNKANLDKIEIPIPPLEERLKLNGVLNSFRDKSRLNRRINQTLEEMAQAVFKSWFVDFDPVKAKMNGEQPEGMDAATASLFPEKLVESELGLIPEGWEVNQLSDICKNHSQSYNLKSVDEVVFVNTGDVQEGDFLHKNYSPVVGLPGQAKKAIKEDDILYSEIRPKNKRFAYVDFDVSDYVVSTKFMVIQANEKVHPRLLYMILTRQNTIDEFNIIADSRSGTFPQITFKAISNLEFCMAPREIQDAFVSQIMPMIKLQSSLKSENKQLAEMRDTLLPKLLSGEIDLETTIEN